jgi:hypothetical protein
MEKKNNRNPAIIIPILNKKGDPSTVPRSLIAYSAQLNQGFSSIETANVIKGIIGSNIPHRPDSLSSVFDPIDNIFIRFYRFYLF